jgi:hypothetical protein
MISVIKEIFSAAPDAAMFRRCALPAAFAASALVNP